MCCWLVIKVTLLKWSFCCNKFNDISDSLSFVSGYLKKTKCWVYYAIVYCGVVFVYNLLLCIIRSIRTHSCGPSGLVYKLNQTLCVAFFLPCHCVAKLESTLLLYCETWTYLVGILWDECGKSFLKLSSDIKKQLALQTYLWQLEQPQVVFSRRGLWCWMQQ